MIDQYCPLRPGHCRHISIPLEVKRIERFKEVGSLRVPDGFETRVIPIPGKEYCNNLCCPVSEVGHCPLHPAPRTGQRTIISGEWL